MYSALSTLNTTSEVLLSKALNPQLLPGRRSIKWLTTAPGVCVHFGWVNAEHEFRVFTILGCMSLHFHFQMVIVKAAGNL